MSSPLILYYDIPSSSIRDDDLLKFGYDKGSLQSLCDVRRHHLRTSPEKRFELIKNPKDATDPSVVYNVCPNLWNIVDSLLYKPPENLGYDVLPKEYLKNVKIDCTSYDQEKAALLVHLFEKRHGRTDLSGSYYYAETIDEALAVAKYTSTLLQILGKPEWIECLKKQEAEQQDHLLETKRKEPLEKHGTNNGCCVIL